MRPISISMVVSSKQVPGQNFSGIFCHKQPGTEQRQTASRCRHDMSFRAELKKRDFSVLHSESHTKITVVMGACPPSPRRTEFTGQAPHGIHKAQSHICGSLAKLRNSHLRGMNQFPPVPYQNQLFQLISPGCFPHAFVAGVFLQLARGLPDAFLNLFLKLFPGRPAS